MKLRPSGAHATMRAFDSDERECRFDDWTARGFTGLDPNRDRAITSAEWHWSRASFDARDLDRNGRLTREEFNGAASQPVRSAAFKAGHERGLIEGRQAGREDKQAGAWDLEGQRELEQSDSGYEARFGPRPEYQAGYREAFRRSYRDGYGAR